MYNFQEQRRAGVLLHVTSLPGEGAWGRFDRNARRFVDWMQDAGFSVWQVLPLGPTHGDRSPYLSLSVFAGNPDLITLEALSEDVGLANSWLTELFRGQSEYRREQLVAALEASGRRHSFQALPGANEFLQTNQDWLQDYAQFMTLRQHQQQRPWWEWPAALRHRERKPVREVLNACTDYYRAIVIEQYLFERQWQALKRYANARNISLFGDMPLYVSHDSADVWANREYFTVDADGQPTAVAGVPPDLFSDTGQLWGNPVYQWQALEEDGFSWWIDRVKRQMALFDLLRIDHFRALQAYWRIPAGAETAAGGVWVEAPGDALLEQLRAKLGGLPLVAEDLGYITAEVHQLREKYHIPGMKVLQFAFDGSHDNPHLPAFYTSESVAYAGTHDNDTVLAWFAALPESARSYIRSVLGVEANDSILDGMIETLLGSDAGLVILTMQDILALGAGNRMNTPATATDNWHWRFRWEQLDPAVSGRYHELLEASDRV
ncbi:MAG: 4-alpha-glucanotransferase [Thiotrichales bacterium]